MANGNPDTVENTPAAVEFDIQPYDHLSGNADAKITLVVFQDFTCPYSREYMRTLESYIKDYGQQIRIVFKHFPLNFNNERAISAAVAAECAAEQDKFWQYSAALFDHQDIITTDIGNAFFLDIDPDIDKSAMSACLAENNYRSRVEANYHEGLLKGVIGTPTSFLNGRYLPGVLPYYDLAAHIDPLIKK